MILILMNIKEGKSYNNLILSSHCEIKNILKKEYLN